VNDCWRLFKDATNLPDVPETWKDKAKNAIEKAIEQRRLAQVNERRSRSDSTLITNNKILIHLLPHPSISSSQIRSAGTDVLNQVHDPHSLFGADLTDIFAASNAGARNHIEDYLLLKFLHLTGCRAEHTDHTLVKDIVMCQFVEGSQYPGEVMLIIDISKQGNSAASKSHRVQQRTTGVTGGRTVR
jgi:hypothetical protein